MFKVTDMAFRVLCREQGASLAFAEMTHCQAVFQNSRIRAQMLQSNSRDKPLGIQLSGNNPLQLAQSIRLLEEQADVFDLNLGCPSARTCRNGIGAALLSKPDKIAALVSAMRRATHKPVTAKIRLPNKSSDAILIAKCIENAGADALTIHARTVPQGRSGDINTALVTQIKNELSIPVISNGGIWNAKRLHFVLEKTGCDAVMLARAAIGNPGIFAQLQGRQPITRAAALNRYLDLCSQLHFTRVGRIKTQCLYFLKGHPAEVKQRFTRARTFEELQSLAGSLEAPVPAAGFQNQLKRKPSFLF